MKSFLTYWMPVILWAGLIFALSSIPNLKSELPSGWDLVLRKCAHIAEYALLAFLLLRACGSSGRVSWFDVFVAIVITGLFAASDEIHQGVVVGRHASFWDASLDVAAGIVGSIVGKKILNTLQDRKKFF